MYTSELNCQILLSLLKAHGISNIIANPGTSNAAFVGSVQGDPWFHVYSAIDERHAAYMAVGMAAATGKPVVINCTGATSSRNYLPALTEAFYRKIPVLAVTSLFDMDGVGNLQPQAIDRSVSQRDVVRKSFVCRTIKDAHDQIVCERILNDAILELSRDGGGPVHINLETTGCARFDCTALPTVKKAVRITVDNENLPDITRYSKIAIFVGSGIIDSNSIAEFATHHNCVVFADCSSGYHLSTRRIHASLLCTQNGFASNPEYSEYSPDLIIDFGEISGDYPTILALKGTADIWRVSEDGTLHSRFGMPSNTFAMSAKQFCSRYPSNNTANIDSYYSWWRSASNLLQKKEIELPFSNPWIAKETAPSIPRGSILHLGILNSLRSWNLFPVNDEVACSSNVGGFGIDGCMSTLIGSSLSSAERLHIGVFGDLAFLYDLNALGNRHIGNNLRILLINNGCGAEFRMYFNPVSQFGEKTNDYIAAGGHFNRSSSNVVKNFVEGLGWKYIHASNCDEFRAHMSEFLSTQSARPILMECATNADDESNAHNIVNTINPYEGNALLNTVSKIVPQGVKTIVRSLVSS